MISPRSNITGRPVKIEENDYLEYTDMVNSQLTIYGQSKDLDAGTDAEVWKIWRVINLGSIRIKQWAKKSGSSNAEFVHVWDDRENLFDAIPFSNPASLLFDGADEYVNFGDNYTFGPATAFSWSFWMKAQNFSAQRAMIAKTSQDINVYGYSFQHNSSGNLFAQMRAPLNLRQHTYSTTLTAGVWYHICFTYAGGSNISGLKAYINGSVEPAPSSAVTASWTVTDPLTIGNRGNTFYFSGNLNNIFVANKELSSSEVAEQYNSGSPIDPRSTSIAANVQSYWLFNTATNFPTEVDQEGSVNGTLVNMESSDYDTGDVP